MIFHLKLAVLILAIISFEHESINAQYVPAFTSLVAPVTKHTDSLINPLYSVQIMTKYVNSQFIHTNFLIDLEAPFIWYDCIVQWNSYPGSCSGNTICASPVSCEEYQCTDVRSTTSFDTSSCPPVTNTSTLPGWGFCTCPVSVINPVNRSCNEALLNYDEFHFNGTDGRNAFPDFIGVYPNAACASSSTFGSFPANVTGVMAFSSSPHALPAYLFYGFERSVSICLPSAESTTGVLFIGSSSYYLLPNSEVDVRSLLSYTPLLKHRDSFGYFIGVKTIVIKKRSISVPENGTTKISTTEPYTTLRTDIYRKVIRRFAMVTKRLRPAKPVTPFDLCFGVSGTEAGLKVPDIDLSLEDGKKWSISSANLMKRVSKDVACLAFVDGGVTSEDAIVIGAFQMEDNFVVFDLVNSTFGFSSSLLNKGISCGGFNFTRN